MEKLKIEDMVRLHEVSKKESPISKKELKERYGVRLYEGEVIATRDFSQGETIKEVNAYGITDLETMMQFEKRYEDKNEDIDPIAQRLINDSIQIDKGIYLVSKSDFEFKIKHGCNPNTAFVPYKDSKGKIKYAFKALKPIKKGDKIRFDYSTVTGDEYILECSCGEENCRGFAGRPAIHSKEEKEKILARYPEGGLLPYIKRELEKPFPGKKLKYLDEPYAETTIYTFDGLKKRKTFNAKMRNMRELIERCSRTFHPKFREMMMEYIEEE